MTTEDLNLLGLLVMSLGTGCNDKGICEHCKTTKSVLSTEFLNTWEEFLADASKSGTTARALIAQTLAQGFLMGQESSKVGASEAPNYQVNNPQVKEQLILIGRKIKESLLPGYGFTLFLFGYGNNHDLFYLSSAKREDMILTIKEFLKRQVQ